MGTKYKVLKLRLGIIVERTAPVDLGAEVRRVVFVNENVLWVRIIALHTRTFVLEKGHKRCAGADATFVQQGNCVRTRPAGPARGCAGAWVSVWSHGLARV